MGGLSVDKNMWLVYSLLAGLCWGTYVPFIQQGGRGLGNSFGSFLCVGVAYFLIAVLFPLALFFKGQAAPAWNWYGVIMATLAGVAGALGALGVIYANSSARALADAEHVNYALYIGPIIFATAPLLNTLISLFWHPSPKEGPFVFGFEDLPGIKFFIGIILMGAGTFLVLYSKEEGEKKPAGPPTHAAAAQVAPESR
jgi:drug/metabolite transporter (DMT)-like permease